MHQENTLLAFKFLSREMLGQQSDLRHCTIPEITYSVSEVRHYRLEFTGHLLWALFSCSLWNQFLGDRVTAEERSTICSGLKVTWASEQNPSAKTCRTVRLCSWRPGHLRTFLGFLGINRHFKSGKTTIKLQLGSRLWKKTQVIFLFKFNVDILYSTREISKLWSYGHPAHYLLL